MERDADIASCQTAKSADLGGYDNTTVGVGTHPVTSPQPLTYATSHVLRDGTPSVLIGRVPFDTATVRLILGDASTESASLGHGLWLAWLATPATPVTIWALDASGAVVGKISDPAGIKPDGGSIAMP